jgi:uncharacterized protein YbaA (DUF1428 family)
MAYVDAFVLAVPKHSLEAYKAMARRSGEVWKESGALAYVECIGNDVPYGELTSFPQAVQAKDNDVVAFSWIVYESREQRDAVNAKVMADRGIHGRRLHTIFSDQFSLFLRGMLGSGAKTASDRQKNSQSALH